MTTRQARAAHRWAVGLAATSLTAFIASTAILLSDAELFPGADLLRFLLGTFFGPLAFALSVTVLLRKSGRLSASGALRSAAAAVPACGLAAVTVASLAVGVEESDAGARLGWFGSATLLFCIAAWVFGTLSLMAPLRSVTAGGLPGTVALAAFFALVLGGLLLLAQLFGTLAAAVLLLVALHPGARAHRGAQGTPGAPANPWAAGARPAVGPASEEPRGRGAAAAACLVSVVLGIGCAVFALSGSSWTSLAADATRAMNLGLAAGALAAIPAVIAAGVVLVPRLGAVMSWAAALLCAGLLMEAAAQLTGSGDPAQWPLTLAAALSAGFALSLSCGRLIPDGRFLRTGTTVLLGFAGVIPGLVLVTAAGFITPLAAAVLFVLLLRGRGKTGGGKPALQPA